MINKCWAWITKPISLEDILGLHFCQAIGWFLLAVIAPFTDPMFISVFGVFIGSSWLLAYWREKKECRMMMPGMKKTTKQFDELIDAIERVDVGVTKFGDNFTEYSSKVDEALQELRKKKRNPPPGPNFGV